jgi:hypothetical protein
MAKRVQQAAARAKVLVSTAAADADARCRRTLRRNNTASIVQRILTETFGDMSDAEKDGVKVAGVTLRERLTADKTEQRHNSDSKVVMGKKYYDQRRAEFSNGTGARAQLLVKNEAEVPNDKLVQAVRLARQAAPQRGQLYDYLANSNLCSQSEMVGLARFFLELKPWSSDANLKLALAILKYWIRVSAENTYNDELDVVRPHVDKTLMAALSSMKSANVPMKVFWVTYSDMAKYIVNTTDVDTLLDVRGDWGQVGGQLEAVTGSSQLGMAMFGFALYEHQVLRCSKIIEAEVLILAGGQVTQAAIDQVQVRVVKKMEELPGHEKLNVVRVVGVAYRGTVVKVQVDTLRQEIEFKIAAFLKTQALSIKGAGGISKLTPLFCEMALAVVLPPFAHGIDNKLVERFNLARTTANGMLAVIDHSNGLYVKNALDTKLDVLTQIDSTFVIEAAWFLHMHTAGGQALLEVKLLQPLPNAPGVHDPKQAYNALQLVKQSQLYTFVAPQHQGAFNVGMEMVKAIASDRLPSTKVTEQHENLQVVLDRMAFYVHLALPAGSKSKVASLHGKEALSQKLQTISLETGAGESVSNERLKEFHTFNWLLTAEERATHNQLVKDAFHGTKGGAKSSSSSSGTNPKQGGTKRKHDEKTAGEKKLEQEQNTLSLFK